MENRIMINAFSTVFDHIQKRLENIKFIWGKEILALLWYKTKGSTQLWKRTLRRDLAKE